VNLVPSRPTYIAGSATALANGFSWDRYQTFCDLGTAQGVVPVQLAMRHHPRRCTCWGMYFTTGGLKRNGHFEAKRTLLRRVYDSLPVGGAVIVYEMLIDDDRRTNAAGLLMSLNMLLLSHDGFDYTGADCRGWLAEAGFRESTVQPLIGPESMVVGIK
jgi:hypothetical protein